MPYTDYKQTQQKSRASMGVAYNDEDLFSMMESDIRGIVTEVGNEIFSIFFNDYLRKYAISGHNSWYVGTGEFEQAWRLLSTRKTQAGIQATIIYDPSGMSHDGWEHGSLMEKWGSAVPYMADLLNKEGSTSSLNWNHREKAYWDEFVSDMFDRGEVDRLFYEKFRL